jgi:hypothetical protein
MKTGYYFTAKHTDHKREGDGENINNWMFLEIKRVKEVQQNK